MANKPGGPGKPIYIGKPKPRPKPGDKMNKPAKPGEKVMKPLPVKPGAGSKPAKPMPGKPSKPVRPGGPVMKPLPVKPGIGKPGSAQERQKKLKTLEDQMMKAKKKK